eukprot:g8199.t1
MKIDALSLLCWLILLQSHITFVEGLVVTGKLETANSFEYITSFCFANEKLVNGRAHISLHITQDIGANYGVTFFYHNDRDHSITDAIFDNSKNCLQRIAAVYPHRNNHFETKQPQVTFTEIVLNGTGTKKQKTMSTIWSPNIDVTLERYGWFSVVISNCNFNKYELDNGCFNNPCNRQYKEDNDYKKRHNCETDHTKCDFKATTQFCQGSIKLSYEMVLKNGDSHFSYNEFYDLSIAIIFFVVYIFVFGTYISITTCLSKKVGQRAQPHSDEAVVCQVLSQHKTVNYLGISIFLKLVANLVDLVRLSTFAQFGQIDGGYRSMNVISLMLHHIMDTIFILDIMLIAKGWTVIRRKISASGRVKLAIVMTIYTMIGIVAVMNFAFTDAHNKMWHASMYRSAPGEMLVFVRVFIMGWYIYAAVTTFGKPSFRRRKKFYALYFPAALFYLIYVPLLQLTTFDMDRSEAFKWVSNIGTCLGHTGFLYLFWPSNYNSFFPFAFETKEQEMARIDARRKIRARSIFNKVTTDTVRSGEDVKRTERDLETESFGPTYERATIAESSEIRNRHSRRSVSGGNDGISQRENILRLSSSLRAKLGVVNDYSQDLEREINLLFEEDEAVDMENE